MATLGCCGVGYVTLSLPAGHASANALPSLPHHPVPSLRGPPILYTNRHAVCYFTALLCGTLVNRVYLPPASGSGRACVAADTHALANVGRRRVLQEGLGGLELLIRRDPRTPLRCSDRHSLADRHL